MSNQKLTIINGKIMSNSNRHLFMLPAISSVRSHILVNGDVIEALLPKPNRPTERVEAMFAGAFWSDGSLGTAFTSKKLRTRKNERI